MELTSPGHLDNETFSQNITKGLTDQDSFIYSSVPVWARILMRVFICLVAVIGIGGNILLTAVLGSRKKRSSTDILVLALAVSDIISLSLRCPYAFLSYSKTIWENISTDWLCRLNYFTQVATFLISLLLVSGIAVDRYMKVFRPHISGRKTILAAKLACLCIYCVSTLIVVPILFSVRSDGVGGCTRDLDSPVLHMAKATMVVIPFLSIVSMLIIVPVYMKIGIFLRKRASVGVTQSPLPGPSNQSEQNTQNAIASANKGNGTELKTFSVLKPEQGSATLNNARKSAIVDKSNQTNARTSVIMMLLTIIHFLTRVLPMIILFIGLRITNLSFNNLEMYIGWPVMLGKSVNHILFAASSSEFRRQLKGLLCKSSP